MPTWYQLTLKKYIVTDSLSDTPTTLHCLNWYLIYPFPSYSAAWWEPQRHEYIIVLHIWWSLTQRRSWPGSFRYIIILYVFQCSIIYFREDILLLGPRLTSLSSTAVLGLTALTMGISPSPLGPWAGGGARLIFIRIVILGYKYCMYCNKYYWTSINSLLTVCMLPSG